tara:strand:- start:2441 stop:3319 length:879 start_codon:yes stop_codon:yes gene_type:complete
MKFPNPFEAFNKTKEGLDGSTPGEGEDGSTSIEISGNLYNSKNADTSYEKVALGFFWGSFVIFWLVLFTIMIANKTTGIMRIATLAFFTLVYTGFMTISIYSHFFGKSVNEGVYFSVIFSIYSAIIIPVIILLHPSFHIVDIFGNTIGYMCLRYGGGLFGDLNFINGNFVSTRFPNADIDYSPLINVFSVNNFKNIFSDFIKKTCNTTQDSSIDFKFNEDNIQSGDDETKFNNWKSEDFNIYDGKGETMDELYKNFNDATNTKHKIGEFVWLYIASIIAIFTSVNALSTNAI